MTLDDLVDHLDHPDMPYDPERDIARMAPDLTIDDAYRLQFALMRRRAERGDRVVGYQASLTSAGAARAFPQYPSPYLGCLLRSNIKLDDEPMTFECEEYLVETEIGVIFKHDLAGADLMPADVVNALQGYIGALEMAPLRPGTREGRWSAQQLVATHNTGSRIILGSKIVPPHVDMRTEAAVVTTNGVVRASAAGVETLGGPIRTIIAMAGILHSYGLGFRAGQVVITGSLPPPQPVRREDATAAVDFTRLGSIAVRFRQ